MYLKSLELQGFKSFPDKIRLTFDKGLTAVVGPNGSGKSNIGDSVRWVLGEQSTKTLRGNKMEDVIFSGTVARKPVGFAMVTLNIDNSDRELNSDDDEVSVTRKLYRSGESEYKINGKNVRLKDINELFMDTGLGVTVIRSSGREELPRLSVQRAMNGVIYLKKRQVFLNSDIKKSRRKESLLPHRIIC